MTPPNMEAGAPSLTVHLENHISLTKIKASYAIKPTLFSISLMVLVVLIVNFMNN